MSRSEQIPRPSWRERQIDAPRQPEPAWTSYAWAALLAGPILAAAIFLVGMILMARAADLGDPSCYNPDIGGIPK